jgi:hypothetical protein
MNTYVNDHDLESYIKLTCDVSLKNFRYFRDDEPEVLVEISKLDDIDRPPLLRIVTPSSGICYIIS